MATELLAGLDPLHQTKLLQNVAARNPDLAQEIRKRLMSFERLAGLELELRQRLLSRVPIEKLALALRALPDPISLAMFEALSIRMAADVRDEMFAQGPRRISDVERARSEILQLAQSLIPEAFQR